MKGFHYTWKAIKCHKMKIRNQKLVIWKLRKCGRFKNSTKRVRIAFEIIKLYFSELKDCLKDVLSLNTINYDERTVIILVLWKFLWRILHRIIDTSRSNTTVIFAISEDGKLLPSYIVYKAKHLYTGWIALRHVLQEWSVVEDIVSKIVERNNW